MLRIALYDDDELLLEELYQAMFMYLKARDIAFRMHKYTETDTLLAQPYFYDLYLIDILTNDLPAGLELAQTLYKRADFLNFIFLCDNYTYVSDAYLLNALMYLVRPLNVHKLYQGLDKARDRIKQEYLIIHTTEGFERVLLNSVYYIDIAKRNLCYHFDDGTEKLGISIRTSFKDAMQHAMDREQLLFLPPSLIINLDVAKAVFKDRVIFENGTSFYLPVNARAPTREAWLQYYSG